MANQLKNIRGKNNTYADNKRRGLIKPNAVRAYRRNVEPMECSHKEREIIERTLFGDMIGDVFA